VLREGGTEGGRERRREGRREGGREEDSRGVVGLVVFSHDLRRASSSSPQGSTRSRYINLNPEEQREHEAQARETKEEEEEEEEEEREEEEEEEGEGGRNPSPSVPGDIASPPSLPPSPLPLAALPILLHQPLPVVSRQVSHASIMSSVAPSGREKEEGGKGASASKPHPRQQQRIISRTLLDENLSEFTKGAWRGGG
jgi:hypothetical protein